MTSVSSIGVKNLRSLRAIDPMVELAPITILLGRNSVGKSTFARLFPLLRQSCERRKRSPVLWFGDLVDFGSIGKAISIGQKEMELLFEVRVSGSQRIDNIASDISSEAYWQAFRRKAMPSTARLRLVLAEDPTSRSSVAKRLDIEIFGGRVEIQLDTVEVEVRINGVALRVPRDHRVFHRQGDLLPKLIFFREEQANDRQSLTSTRNVWSDSVAEVLKSTLHGNTSTTTARRISSQLCLGSPEEIEAHMPSIPGPHGWTSFSRNESWRRAVLPQIHTWLIAEALDDILERLDTLLSRYFQGVRYLKPLRATAQRYYRRQDVAVAEIDPDGSNFPMFLDSLRPWELHEFKNWLNIHLDIEVHPSREGEQLIVMAKGPGDDRAFNIADMGFGISQVLPIAAQLWSLGRNSFLGAPASVVVLEQPELHLHPEFQARLADVFAGTATAEVFKGRRPTLVVETHSQHLVNRLGQLIESERLSPADVKVMLFEPPVGSAQGTSVRVSQFDSRGVLQNWPYGFFEPGLD